MTRDEFFNKKAAGALWDVGVSIKRGNPLPLDADSVFGSLADAQTYVAGVLAYPGQILAVVPETGDTVIYYVKPKADGSGFELAEVGGKVEIDSTTIVTNEAGQLALKGFVDAEEGAQLTKSNGELKWIVPSAETVEGLKAAVQALQTTVASHTEDITDLKKLTIKKLTTASEGASASYQLEKDGVKVGDVIDIPKDMVVESGTVETYTDETAPTVGGEKLAAGTYIVLTIANKAGDKLYIPATSLIDVYTAENKEGSVVKVEVANNKISANLTDEYKTTLDGAVTKANSAVQAVIKGENAGQIKVDGTVIDVITKDQTITFVEETITNKIAQKTGEITGTIKDYVDDQDLAIKKAILGEANLEKDVPTLIGEEDTAIKEHITNTLADYLKSTDAESTYATKDALEETKTALETAIGQVTHPKASNTDYGTVKGDGENIDITEGNISIKKVGLSVISQDVDELILDCNPTA